MAAGLPPGEGDVMSSIEIFAPLGAFFMITISVALITRLIATGMLNRTIREALRSDPGSVPILAAKLEARQPWADALLGWIFLALAAVLIGFALFEEGYRQRELFQAAVVPVVLGLTVLLYVRLAQPKPPAA
jgi:hypothetical protein